MLENDVWHAARQSYYGLLDQTSWIFFFISFEEWKLCRLTLVSVVALDGLTQNGFRLCAGHCIWSALLQDPVSFD